MKRKMTMQKKYIFQSKVIPDQTAFFATKKIKKYLQLLANAKSVKSFCVYMIV